MKGKKIAGTIMWCDASLNGEKKSEKRHRWRDRDRESKRWPSRYYCSIVIVDRHLEQHQTTPSSGQSDHLAPGIWPDQLVGNSPRQACMSEMLIVHSWSVLRHVASMRSNLKLGE